MLWVKTQNAKMRKASADKMDTRVRDIVDDKLLEYLREKVSGIS
jgi:hypothetical protein